MDTIKISAQTEIYIQPMKKTPIAEIDLTRLRRTRRASGFGQVIGDDGQQNIAVTHDLRHSPLMSAIELENAVQKLPPDELDRFAAWFEQFVDSQWDDVLSADVAAGRLDAVARKADSDF